MDRDALRWHVLEDHDPWQDRATGDVVEATERWGEHLPCGCQAWLGFTRVWCFAHLRDLVLGR